MTALVDVAIAMLVATGLATLIVKLPMAMQSWFRQLAGVFFFAILTVNNVFAGTGRDEVGLKATTTRETFLFVWFIVFVPSLFACAYIMRNWRH